MVDRNDILISEDVVIEPERVRAELARRVGEILDGPGSGEVHIERLVVPVKPFDPFTWLGAQKLFPRIYWNGRDDDLVTAAAGAADFCFGGLEAGYHNLRSQLDVVLPNSDNRVRYFGGFRFDRGAERSSEWESFGTFTFVLPRFEFAIQADKAILACNLILPRDADLRGQILRDIDLLSLPVDEVDDDLPLPLSRIDRPDVEGWTSNVEWALNAFKEGRMDKVVLARRADLAFAAKLDPLAILKRLERATANSFRYGFDLSPGVALVGASPERLFRRSGRRVWTEAVAGTRPRGQTAEEDAVLLAELLDSEKDQREHAYVRDSIRESLSPLCDTFYIEPVASEMQLARGWHLVSRSRGMVKSGVHGSDVMRALHPTPAVGGSPTDVALRAIRELEPFDRGWYAGPVGWIGSRGAEFAVALRCGLVRGNTISLYSGAGIVEGSRPDDEWQEIEQKIGDFMRIFGLD